MSLLLPSVALTEALVRSLGKRADVAAEEKANYQDKLEGTRDAREVYKYVFLINNASVELYVQQSRQQATTSFSLSARVAVAGFLLLAGSVVVGVFADYRGHAMTPAYLAAIGGALTEFIAGVFFWLYNRSLAQINLFYEGMVKQQADALIAFGHAGETSLRSP
jgi:hypothetical protein